MLTSHLRNLGLDIDISSRITITVTPDDVTGQLGDQHPAPHQLPVLELLHSAPSNPQAAGQINYLAILNFQTYGVRELRNSPYAIIRYIVPTMLVDKAFQIDSITLREIHLLLFRSDLWILYGVRVFLVVIAPM